ncbi:5'-nucleotidase, partial [Pseudomonas sp. AH2 (2023)]
LEQGDAYLLVEKLLSLNAQLDKARVEVILVSRNSADTGLRVFNSIQYYGLDITRAAFVGGRSPYPYLAAFGCHLFLSTHPDDVRSALEAGFAAATILSGGSGRAASAELRIAFDGDAVLFSDESERVYQSGGLEAFQASERESAREPLGGGPFKPFLAALNLLQREFPEDACPIRTALVTARSAPAHERVIRTLREWDIRLDESLFLGGLEKSAFLEAFAADVFFDDQPGHCEKAREVVATGHVPHGISNELKI